MGVRLSAAEAERILTANTEADQSFFMCNGSVISNLRQLLDIFQTIEDNVFRHHVNDERNDFSNWIRDIVRDAKLANDLQKAKKKAQAIAVLRQRITWLEKKAVKPKRGGRCEGNYPSRRASRIASNF
ncbi:hypothetical protein COV22_03575 [Candidatus Woesearchaeota archaeon CG10_big_fil_rev_8_21_14_0_10_47_5]|nr:MAG: hypothetical protein COV22_03575 [Candidatus Woesearchaeota archaeon CG10_big_fil_rev_8_21_14_0_10_47_5]